MKNLLFLCLLLICSFSVTRGQYYNKVYDVQDPTYLNNLGVIDDRDQNPNKIIRLSNGHDLYFYESGWSGDNSRKYYINEIDGTGNIIRNQELSWPASMGFNFPSLNYRLECIETSTAHLIMVFAGEDANGIDKNTYVASLDYANGSVDWCKKLGNYHMNPSQGYLLEKIQNAATETYMVVTNHTPVGMACSNGQTLANGACVFAASIDINGTINWQNYFPTVITNINTHERFYEDNLVMEPTGLTYNSSRNSYDMVGYTFGSCHFLFMLSLDNAGNIVQDYHTIKINHSIVTRPEIVYIDDAQELAITYGFSYFGGGKKITSCGGEVENYIALQTFNCNDFRINNTSNYYWGHHPLAKNLDANLTDEPVTISYNGTDYIISCNILYNRVNPAGCNFVYEAALLFIDRMNNKTTPTRYIAYPNNYSLPNFTKLFDMDVNTQENGDILLLGHTDLEQSSVTYFQDANGQWWATWENGHKIRVIKTTSIGDNCDVYKQGIKVNLLPFESLVNNTNNFNLENETSESITLSNITVVNTGCDFAGSPAPLVNGTSQNTNQLSSELKSVIKNSNGKQLPDKSQVKLEKLEFSIIPNNDLQSYTLKATHKINGAAEVLVVDINGKELVKNKVTFENGISTINLAKLTPGVYLITAFNKSIKFIKQ